ncbi:hypothetical protein GQR58_020746 [Nymphon striatum]|nr:hypothetical protein GQR58_020746 [Nymphon striatum]
MSIALFCVEAECLAEQKVEADHKNVVNNTITKPFKGTTVPQQAFKVNAIKTLIQRSKERCDDIHVKLQTIIDSQGDNATRERRKLALPAVMLGAHAALLFSAGHFHYARYISWHLLDMRYLLLSEAKGDLIARAHVCRHSEGSWNSVSGDQFGEQTAIKTGKGGLKGMTLSPELVTEWIDSFPISVYLSDAMEHLYSDQTPKSSPQTKHKEEGVEWQKLDLDDREKISLELAKHSHSMTVHSKILYNIVNGQVAPADVNVEECVVIGQTMAATSLQNTLPTGFHGKISNKVKTMEQLKRGIKVGGKTIFDLQAIFVRLLVVGKQRQFKLTSIFQYELCEVPPSLIDECGCLRKGNKAVLANRLGIEQVDASTPMLS